MKQLWIVGIVCLLSANSLRAQTDSSLLGKGRQNKDSLSKQNAYTIEGYILDINTDEPLPFATVQFSGTVTGVKTDIDGYFFFQSDVLPSDSIRISVIGYNKITLAVDRYAPYQKLKIELERSTKLMREVVITVNKNPGLKLIKKVIENKPYNNHDKADNYTYEVYNKLELDVTRIRSRTFKKNPILKNFAFIQNYIDSSSEDKPFLPLFLTETLSDYYYQKKPKKTKEFIKGTKISGYRNESVSSLLGSMYQNINVYDNEIPVFDIRFISPIADNAPLFYRYEIVDTQEINNQSYYKVLFVPKRQGDHTFNGDLWIHDKDYAVQKASLQITPEQNINWVEKVNLVQEYELLHDTIWFLVKDKFYVDFITTKKNLTEGLIGRKTTTYRKIEINTPEVSRVLNDKKNKESIIVQKGSSNRNENFWNENRHEELSRNEKTIYKMIDTIQSVPIYNKYYNLMFLLGTGIKEFGPLELGSLYNIYSYNPVEGARFRLNIGTTPRLFKNVYLNGYLAYGTRDQRFKYNANILWLLDRKPRRYIFLSYKHDVDNSISYYDDNAGSLDNLFSNIARKPGIPWKLVFVDQKRFEFFNETYQGFQQMLSFENKNIKPYAPLPTQNIFYDRNGKMTDNVSISELGLELRFAYLEKFVEGNYYRVSTGTKYPAIKLYAGLGIKNVLLSDHSYFKLRFSITDNQPIPMLGKVYYNFFAGKIWGTLPYTLLEVHPGNEFYYYNARTFNMMNRFEYISDTYAGIALEHNLGTFVFKYVPLLKKSRVRTFWNLKGVYGYLSNENKQLNFNKGYEFQSLRQSPYLEAGTGVENIFRVLRLDFVWRVLPIRTYNDSPARRFGIFGSLKLEF